MNSPDAHGPLWLMRNAASNMFHGRVHGTGSALTRWYRRVRRWCFRVVGGW